MRRLSALATLAATALLWGCGDPDRLETGATPDSLLPVPPSSIDSGSFGAADFRRLTWLHGRWRGFMPDGGTFYEQYEFLNDTTIVMHAFADSSFVGARDSARITLRQGVIASESPRSRWVATRVDSSGADFAPQRGAGNWFTWMRESPTQWSANLRWTDADGRPRNQLYAMHKFGR